MPKMLLNTCLHTLPPGLAFGLKLNANKKLLVSVPSRKNSNETELSAQDPTFFQIAPDVSIMMEA